MLSSSSSSQTRFEFFDLPPELRDMIYPHCLGGEPPYVLNPVTNKMTFADGSLVDLAITLTCKRAYEEAHYHTLKNLSFSPWADDTARTFEYIAQGRQSLYMRRLLGLVVLDEELCAEIKRDLPRFAPYLEAAKTRSHLELGGLWPKSCGQTPSVFRNLVTSCLRKAVAETRYGDRDGEAHDRPLRPTKLGRADADLIYSDTAPWSIPHSLTQNPIDSTVFKSRTVILQHLKVLLDLDLRYSAAAVAVRFLESVPRCVRMRLRRIVLHEDRPGVGFAECHGLGLIPYCQENPQLRIERKVNLWKNALHTTTAHGELSETRLDFYRMKDNSSTTGGILQANHISHPIAVWIMEAVELEAAGMPPGSFTLTLQGDSVCSKIFRNVVVRDAAWQLAFEACFEGGAFPQGLHPRNPYSRKSNDSWYLFEGFPQALQDILDNRSVVRCDFYTGTSSDMERLVEGRLAKVMHLDTWKRHWRNRKRQFYEPRPPLPNWRTILRQNGCFGWSWNGGAT